MLVNSTFQHIHGLSASGRKLICYAINRERIWVSYTYTHAVIITLPYMISWNHMEGQSDKCRSTESNWTKATTRQLKTCLFCFTLCRRKEISVCRIHLPNGTKTPSSLCNGLDTIWWQEKKRPTKEDLAVNISWRFASKRSQLEQGGGDSDWLCTTAKPAAHCSARDRRNIIYNPNLTNNY